ncbi:hypothetical protein H4R19_002321 [Coemansia spiralis]|nr:hypothetical protein H4R19_002321 [Coemansia spiralis]
MVNNAWSMFGDDDGHAMTFSHLRRLCMRFGPINYMAPDQPSGGHPRALRFPELRHINIVSDGSSCSFMDNAVFPSTLGSLVITAGAALYQRLAKAKLQVTNKLELHLRHDPVGDTGIVAAANHILEAADGCRDMRLTIAGPARIPLELFTYTKLTHLELTAPTSVDDMMAHIHSQPRLVSLAVNNLVLTNCKTDLSIPSSTEHELVTPLDTQIGVLSIGGAHSRGWQKKGVSMLKYLLLKMPTLSEVRAQRIPSKPIQAFVNKYAQQYPHLTNIRLQLSSSN